MDNSTPGARGLLRRFRVALALCVLLAGLSLALLSNGRDGFGWAVLNELALFAAAGVAVPFYYELFLRDAEREGFLRELTAALDTRDDTGGLRVHAHGRPAPAEKTAFIAEARTEIIEVGVTLRSLTGYFVSRPERDFTDPVRQLLRRGVHITYLVADPDAPLLTAYADSLGDPGLPARAADAARQLSRVAADFAAEGHLGRMTVRYTRQLPTGYVVLVDPEDTTGRCRTSPYLPGVRRADSPVLDITRAARPEVFARYVTYVRKALEDSREAAP